MNPSGLIFATPPAAITKVRIRTENQERACNYVKLYCEDSRQDGLLQERQPPSVAKGNFFCASVSIPTIY